MEDGADNSEICVGAGNTQYLIYAVLASMFLGSEAIGISPSQFNSLIQIVGYMFSAIKKRFSPTATAAAPPAQQTA
jgi:hypothetical protein